MVYCYDYAIPMVCKKKHMSWDGTGKTIWHSITIMVICPFISIYEIYGYIAIYRHSNWDLGTFSIEPSGELLAVIYHTHTHFFSQGIEKLIDQYRLMMAYRKLYGWNMLKQFFSHPISRGRAIFPWTNSENWRLVGDDCWWRRSTKFCVGFCVCIYI